MTNLALLLGVFVSLCFAHRDGIAGMIRLWQVSPMYSYGFVVPVISAYLLWSRRDALRGQHAPPAWVLGGIVLCSGAVLTTVGRVGSIQLFVQVALILSVVGAALLLFGATRVRTAWASIAYLLLMVPLWDALTEPLHHPFQHQSASLGTAMLRVMHVPAFHEGALITLPNVTLEVARSCSGVNYLVTLLALALPLAYTRLSNVGHRVLLLGFAVGVAAFSNSLRVALIGVLAYLEIGSPLHGPFHMLHGLFVAGIGFMALFAGLHVLSRPQSVGATPVEPLARASAEVRLSVGAVAVLVVVFLALGAGVLSPEARGVPLHRSFDVLPDRIGDWSWDRLARPTLRGADWWVGADQEVSRRYRLEDGTAIDVWVGYFASQRQGKEVATYRSADLHRRAQALTVGSKDAFPANLVQGMNGRPDMLFWYEFNTSAEASAQRAKLRTIWTAVTSGQTNAAVIMIAVASSASATARDRSATLQLAAGPLRHELRNHLLAPRVEH